MSAETSSSEGAPSSTAPARSRSAPTSRSATTDASPRSAPTCTASARARRRRVRRLPRVHRHPHPLRRGRLFWDPALRPSSSQGVTTVVAGNCGFTIAPTPRRAPRRDRTHARERRGHGRGLATLRGIVWDFRTYPEYLELRPFARHGPELHRGTSGHSSVRLFVMGDDAYERAATPEEIQQMCALVIESDRRGRGRVLDQFRLYTSRDGREAGAEPLRGARRGRSALPRGGEHRQGRRARHRRQAVHVCRHVRVPAAHRSPVHLSVVRVANDRHLPQLELHEARSRVE